MRNFLIVLLASMIISCGSDECEYVTIYIEDEMVCAERIDQ